MKKRTRQSSDVLDALFSRSDLPGIVAHRGASSALASFVERNRWFVQHHFPAGGDFHTSPAAEWAIDQGSTANTLPDDVDRELRTDGLPDIGADER